MVSAEIFRVAQATPGDTIRFESIDLETARDLIGAERNKIAALKDRLATGKS